MTVAYNSTTFILQQSTAVLAFTSPSPPLRLSSSLYLLLPLVLTFIPILYSLPTASICLFTPPFRHSLQPSLIPITSAQHFCFFVYFSSPPGRPYVANALALLHRAQEREHQSQSIEPKRVQDDKAMGW
ncbi:hypothetical protein S40293_10711 [Stachybotrys chartarum IBT 40293]|nr:hypothetical protein S40293_10711 [Stachybotrys chartarum IBT 40293]